MPVGMFSQGDIEEMFTYQAPSEEQVEKMKQVRVAAKELALVINKTCPPSADRSAAMRKLREVVTSANQSIIFKGAF